MDGISIKKEDTGKFQFVGEIATHSIVYASHECTLENKCIIIGSNFTSINYELWFQFDEVYSCGSVHMHMELMEPNEERLYTAGLRQCKYIRGYC